MKDCIQTENFRVTVIQDTEAVEVCGALKVRLVIFGVPFLELYYIYN
jgi:glycerol-3-phosphate dehydrogenase